MDKNQDFFEKILTLQNFDKTCGLRALPGLSMGLNKNRQERVSRNRFSCVGSEKGTYQRDDPPNKALCITIIRTEMSVRRSSVRYTNFTTTHWHRQGCSIILYIGLF
jgi:hypothetical protein